MSRRHHVRQHKPRDRHGPKARDAPDRFELRLLDLTERLVQESLGVVDHDADFAEIGFKRSCDISGLRHIATEMGVSASLRRNEAADRGSRLVASRQTKNVITGTSEGRRNAGAETVGNAGHEQKRTRAGHHIHPRILNRMMSCAAQPTVKNNVRMTGMPDVYTMKCARRAKR